jgi:hypothetical protein
MLFVAAVAFFAGIFYSFGPVLAADNAAGGDQITFNRYIRPILSDRCFSCHGPDSISRKADLRFDRKAALFDPIPKDPDKHAFVPGHPEQSEAYRRLTTTDTDDVMPPAKSHLKVSAHEKELIKKWIEQGAKWQEHWAFVAPVRPEAPAVKDAAWPRNDIDRFILANLEAQGIHPSPEADKPTLIRRVTLDLTGLPPTPGEVDSFLADNSANAYEKVVDRLLASPRYGEQMATHWLDMARYADSHGYQSDPERFMWRWRDWVINAYNSNMPFDEFTIEQLAGDLLPNPTIDQKIATGFNRNHRINGEGGIIAEEWRVEGVIDRVDTTSEVWLGLTMGCCRCHDHKFDPITQKEFYGFCGFFNSVNETGVGDTGFMDRGNNVPPILKLPTTEQQKELDTLAARIEAGKSKLKELEKSAADLQAKWELAEKDAEDPDGLVSRFGLHDSLEGTRVSGDVIRAAVDGDAPKFEGGHFAEALKFDGKGAIDAGDAVSFDADQPFSYGAWVEPDGNGGTVFSKMDADPGYRGFDLRVINGLIEVHIIHEWPNEAIKVVSVKPVPRGKFLHLMVTYDGSKKAAGLKVYVNGQIEQTKVEKDNLTGTIITKTPLLIGKRVKSDPFKGKIQDLEFYDRALTAEDVRQLAFGPEAQSLLKVAAEKRTPQQKKQLEELFKSYDPEFSAVRNEIAAATSATEELNKKLPNTMIMEDLPTPRKNYVLIRGQYDKHGPEVPTGLPAVLPPMPAGQPMNRLGLAKWIVDPSNPLTARVQVNRLWEKFFGVGIVKSSENLGTQADLPSNPELLDWLATEFVGEHWDMKAIQKLIVMSAAYRQASTLTPELIERDPDNRLIARGPRLRLPAESIRDQALAVSGLLVEKIGGPSVHPYEPANLWEGNRFGNLSKYVQDKGDGLYRRSLYTFWKRTATPPNMTVFDMPSREYCVLKRSRTDTPLQALDLMNDPTYLESSRVLAEHAMNEGGSTPTDRVTYAFHRAMCRNPTGHELKILLAGFTDQLERYRNDPKAAAEFISVGESPRDKKLDVPELAAYTMTCSVIMNLDEMINKP